MVLSLLAVLTACGPTGEEPPPATITPATAVASPPAPGRPAGEIRPVDGAVTALIFDPATGSAVALSAAPAPALTVLPAAGGPARRIPVPPSANTLTGDGRGVAYLPARGGYHRVDLRSAAVTTVAVEGQRDTDFTAVAHRADGRLVLGSADGAVFTMSSETQVAERLPIFARVDALATVGNTTVVLDRAQTSVTTIDAEGRGAEQALRAGEGATTLVADPAGRVLVADTRGEELLVFGTDPLVMRQRYPVSGGPYGLAGSAGLAWVSRTAVNDVVGYDLSTGIPVERARYPAVQQPNSMAFDDATGTLYVASATGAGVQVIANATGGGR
ncbi:hypothetical protein LV457_10710 [Mycobacterium sp. MYCO198283]|nr:hypothetical protein [Mycobacterium sp. MYCO198283]MCG5432757.1 hypothetical protein [Mycobacterium sp. MYCO198283]